MNFSSRLLTRFNADTPTPVAATTTASEVIVGTYNNVDYEEYLLPDEYSIFLIKFGSDGDDLAARYNSLLTYTKGLLTAIEQTNQVSVLHKQ